MGGVSERKRHAIGRGGLVALLLGLSGCPALGPSEERLGCLRGCAHEKDQCILNAMTPPAIEACDVRTRRCSQTCPQ